MTGNLLMYYQNVRGIRTKCYDLYLSILANNYDVIIITETWLCDGIHNSEFCDQRYEVFRCDRNHILTGKSTGGGVMICVKKELSAYHRDEWSSEQTELVWVTIPAQSLRSGTDLHLVCTYIPGNKKSNLQVNDLNNFWQSVTTAVIPNISHSFMLFGDFNLPFINWDKNMPIFMKQGSIELQRSGFELINNLSAIGFTQYNTYKNTSHNLLDLIFSNLSIDITKCDMPMLPEDHHHPPLIINANDIFIEPLKINTITKYKFHQADYSKIIKHLNDIQWDTELNLNNIDDAVEIFYNHIHNCLKKFVPVKVIKNKQSYPVWYTDALIHIIRDKNKAHRRWKRFKNQLDYDEFNLLRARHHKVERECFNNYVRLVEVKIKEDPKKFWTFVKSRKKISGYPSNMTYQDIKCTDGNAICTAFNDFFNSVFIAPSQHYPDIELPPPQSGSISHVSSITLTTNDVHKCLSNINIHKGPGCDGIPAIFIHNCAPALVPPLTLIYNKSLRERVFPTKWKKVFITPIPKKGSKIKIEQYRPISKLNIFSKIFEKLVYDTLYFTVSSSLPAEQHGFLRGRSTLSNLSVFLSFLHGAMDKQKQVDVVYTDFEKAFDRVDHIILIRKLEHLGIHGDLLRWVESYLNNRSQAVALGGFCSDFIKITSGVPQGSLLGPLLYNVYLYDIYTCFHDSRFLMYADDTKIFIDISNINDANKLQSDLNRLNEYYEHNRITVNSKKCQLITFTRKNKPLNFSYSIQGHPIERTNIVRDLGVHFDSKLNFSEHIDYITNKAYKTLGFVMRTCQPFQDLVSIKCVYYAYVRSILEYASPIWSPQYINQSEQLERIQKKFINFLNYKFKRGFRDYEDSCKHYHSLTLNNRRKLADMSMLYDLVRGRGDPALLAQLGLLVPSSRTRHTQLFRIPYHRVNYTQNTTLTRIAKTYNNIFSDVDPFICSKLTFKKSIIEHLNEH